MTWRIPLSVILTTLLLSCDTGPIRPDHGLFAVGLSRADVLDQFGQPIRTQELVKSGSGIWGPIEDFWPRVPPGATVEIWAFQTTMTLHDNGDAYQQPGQTELYFINHSDKVDGIGFYIESAVYEGN